MSDKKRVVIIGGGFAGLNTARKLSGRSDFHITIIDKRNHHLFQPLLYQVATAALNPADIAVPIRTIFSKYANVEVMMGYAYSVDPVEKVVHTDIGDINYDYLVLACGATHSYFGHDEWETHAPGLKSLEEATEIRRRILESYEKAEIHRDPEIQKKYLTFVVVGGGPTGVEMAGALGEISRFTLSKEFRNIDPKRSRVILIEGGQRILPGFDTELSEQATRDLENLGVTIWTNSIVTDIRSDGLFIGKERIQASTILWAAGVGSVPLNKSLGVAQDRMGRIIVNKDLSIQEYPEIFVAGDQACFIDENGDPLPGIAPVAIQQGHHVPENILADVRGKARKDFHYFDKGIMATIGRERAVVQVGKLKFSGFIAWLAWLFVHIMYLIGFRNRILVLAQWFWSFLTFRRGTRIITTRSWRSKNLTTEGVPITGASMAREKKKAAAGKKKSVAKKTSSKKSSKKKAR